MGGLMAEKTKKRAKSKKSKKRDTKTVAAGPERTGAIWQEALGLENQLEERLLEDAILSAKLALQELDEATRKIPFERRSGLRLREKAIKTERAFNRLRALRQGNLIPERHSDD
jgi:hypothetical protein